MNGHDQMRMSGFKFEKIKVVGRKLMDDESLKHVMVPIGEMRSRARETARGKP